MFSTSFSADSESAYVSGVSRASPPLSDDDKPSGVRQQLWPGGANDDTRVAAGRSTPRAYAVLRCIFQTK